MKHDRENQPTPRPTHAILPLLLALLLMVAGAAVAQDGNGQQDGGQAEPPVDAPVDPPDEGARGRVPMFEVVERTEIDEVGVNLYVDVEVASNQEPDIVIAGPGGLLLEEEGRELVFESLPQGDYMVAATAEEMRLAYGTLTAEDGHRVVVRLHVFDLRAYYADESDTPILGIFNLDVADNVADGEASIAIDVEPGGKIAVVGDDGYAETFISAQDSRVLDDLEIGRYVVAATLEDYRLSVAYVTLEEEDEALLEFELESAQP